MGLLDLIRRDKKQKPAEKPDEVETIVIPEQSDSKLDLSKEIELNFNKLDLDKGDVRAKRVSLMDVSGSMNERIHGRRKIDSLRNVMSKYPDIKMIAFASEVKEVSDSNSIPEPNGGTDLMLALRYVAKLSNLPERIVLISDGEPNHEGYALKEAKLLGLPIDIIFIGKEGSDGDRFMKRLATATGGQNFTVG